jgi:hypothetical protein
VGIATRSFSSIGHAATIRKNHTSDCSEESGTDTSSELAPNLFIRYTYFISQESVPYLSLHRRQNVTNDISNFFSEEADMGTDPEKLYPDTRVYRFGSIAVYRKYVTLEQVQRALSEQVEDNIMHRPHRRLGDILRDNNWITEEQVKSILEEMGVGDE